MIKYIRDNYASERGLARLWLAHIESWLGRTKQYEQVDLSRVERLVFVCLGNICRSPFAEYVARQYGIPTAGFGLSTTTGKAAFALGQQVADQFDIDLSSHLTTDFSDFTIRPTDLLLVMEVRHARRLQDMLGASPAQIALLGHWAKPRRLHIHDPHVHDAVYFRQCYQVLEQATRNLVHDYQQARALPAN